MPMTTTATRPDSWSLEPGSGVDVDDLLAAVRDQGFDLRRSAVVTYLVETGSDRAAAYALRSEARADGWQASLYGDCSGWVVRLCRSRQLRSQLFAGDIRSVGRLAHRHRAVLRGVTVEDPQGDDEWASLAARLQPPAAPRPATRQSARARDERTAWPHSA